MAYVSTSIFVLHEQKKGALKQFLRVVRSSKFDVDDEASVEELDRFSCISLSKGETLPQETTRRSRKKVSYRGIYADSRLSLPCKPLKI